MYKRQLLLLAQLLERALILGLDLLGILTGGLVLLKKPPVSYTHLDVYKRQLYVHRNTLVYRLEKIKKITGLDLREFDHAIAVSYTHL